MFARLTKVAITCAMPLFIASCSSNGQASPSYVDTQIRVDASAAAVESTSAPQESTTSSPLSLPTSQPSAAKSDGFGAEHRTLSSTLCTNVPDAVFTAFKDVTTCEVLAATVKEKLNAGMSAKEIEAELSQLYCAYFALEGRVYSDGVFRLPPEGHKTPQAVPMPLKKGDSGSAVPMPYTPPSCGVIKQH